MVGVNNNKKIQLNSWDNFEIPYFFSRVKIIYSDPIYIDENLDYEGTDKVIKKLNLQLNELQNRALESC